MLAKQVLQHCREKGWQIATAESCTGGLVAAALTDIAGSSDVFDRGFVTYSNAGKTEMLGVDPELINQFGAVSQQVAEKMAIGALRHSDADIAVSITGVAGPGASENKPEGLVWFGLANKHSVVISQKMEFRPLGRHEVRAASVKHALQLLLNT
ncbi:MAG: CinA family protein [Rhodobacteraceae bacterium]|nr:CinA family protein [Paracoccaceae bacterium]